MKCLPLATLAMLAATTGTAGIADEFTTATGHKTPGYWGGQGLSART